MSELPQPKYAAIEYDPSHLDRVSGALGRLAMRVGEHPATEGISADYPLPDEAIDRLISRA